MSNFTDDESANRLLISRSLGSRSCGQRSPLSLNSVRLVALSHRKVNGKTIWTPHRSTILILGSQTQGSWSKVTSFFNSSNTIRLTYCCKQLSFLANFSSLSAGSVFLFAFVLLITALLQYF